MSSILTNTVLHIKFYKYSPVSKTIRYSIEKSVGFLVSCQAKPDSLIGVCFTGAT